MRRELTVDIVTSIDAVHRDEWDALALDDNPFVSHAFLSLLERSGSVGADTGWLPHHVVVRDGSRVVGAAPCYAKLHSYGEYIFDWGIADAAARAGIDYYPKLTVAAPHTPATGPRLLAARELDDDERARIRATIADALRLLARELGASSVHVLFALDDEVSALERAGYHRRATHQFHFRNPGWADFDAFTASLRAEVRKQLKKERRRVSESGLDITLVRGDQATADEWRTMDALYRSTSGKKWGSPYLTPRFFVDARLAVGERALLCFARRGGEIVAGTLSFTSSDAVYGRYWGSFVDVDGLHFELCYYRLIDHALLHGLPLVEAGAQGEHKVKRGYLPVVTHSAHTFLDPRLDDAIARFFARERAGVVSEIERAAHDGPFRADAIPPFPARAGVPLPRPPDARGAGVTSADARAEAPKGSEKRES